MTKRAIVYARVSTDDQAEKGFSLSAQIEAGRKYARVHGFVVTHELIDDGVSGAMAFSERPAGATAWTLLRTGEANVLIVQNVDRLSRDVVNLLVTIRELLRSRAEVHCLDLGRVKSEYDIMLVIRGWQGSDERAKIQERSIRGKRAKLEQGMIVANGRPPYGYDYLRDDKGRVLSFSVNEEQAKVVRLMYQLYTRGDDDIGAYSLFAVAKHLSAAGIAVPHPTTSRRKREAHIWSTCVVGHILQSPVYRGEYRYTVDHEAQFAIKVPAIVDDATWQLAQLQRERNRRKAARNSKREYLLTGLVKCECGRGMSGRTTSQRSATTRDYRYYYCGSLVAHFDFERVKKCKTGNIDADRLEGAVWEFYANLLRNPEVFEAKLREAQQLELEEQGPKRAELDAVNAFILEAEEEATQLATALIKSTGVVEQVLQDKIAAIDERYKALTTRRDELMAVLSNRRLTDRAVTAVLQFAPILGEA
jgi:site-specific DNA recombinase